MHTSRPEQLVCGNTAQWNLQINLPERSVSVAAGVIPIEIWNEISYLDIYIYHILALAIRGLERDINRRKCHFAKTTDNGQYLVLMLNGRLFYDDRPLNG